MHRGSSREVCRRAAGQVKRKLDKSSHRTPAEVSSITGDMANLTNETSGMAGAPRYINSRYVWYKGPLRAISTGPSMVRSSRPMSFTSHLMARAEGIHTGLGQRLQEAKKPQQVVGESLAVADEDTDVDLGDREEQKKLREEPHPRQTLQDEADECATSPPTGRLNHPDPNGDHEPLVDEEVRRGLEADSQVPYGHDREAR